MRIYLFVWSSSIAEIHLYRLDVCWWLSFKTSAWNIYSVSTACVGACVCVWVCASKWPSVCSCMDLCLSMLIKSTDIAVSLLCWFRLKANCSNILPNLLSPSISIFPSVSLLSHHPCLSASAPLSPLSSYTVCASGTSGSRCSVSTNFTINFTRKTFIENILFLQRGLAGKRKRNIHLQLLLHC